MASNIKIVNVEQTQSIQFFNFPEGQGSGFAPDNSIPLVNRKPTILRVYIDANQNDNTIPVPAMVDGVLYALNPNASGGVGIFGPINGPIATRTASRIQRAEPGQTLDFLIPSDICQDQVQCLIVIMDANYENYQNIDIASPTLNFIEVPPMNLHSVLIHYTGVDFCDNPVDAQTTPFDVLSMCDYLLRIYPVSNFIFDGCEELQWNAKLAVGANFYALKAQIDCLRAMSGTNDVYAGLIPPAAGCGGTCGLGGGGAAIFFANESLQQPGAAHEIGHALGRSHAPGCLPSTDPGDQNYPQYDGFPRASIGECGVDWRGMVLFDPNKTFDYMSYCNPVWTSPYGYNQILAALQSGAFSRLTASALLDEPGGPPVAEYHYINFRIDDRVTAGASRVTIVSEFQVRRTRPVSYGSPSEVSVELFDLKGVFLYGTACEADPHVDNNVPFRYFRAYFPHYPELARVRIVLGEAILGDYEVVEKAPKVGRVTVTQSANRLHIKWSGSAPKSSVPALEYGVRFSPDGKKWRALAATTTQTELDVTTDLLPGGERCRVQVVASAGFRTTVHEAKPFALRRKPRIAYIASPEPDAEFEVGQPVAFSGTAASPDFGVAKPDEIVWTSLAAGSLGVGQQILVTSLPVGHHWVTLQAPDGVGGLASKSVAVRVRPRKSCPPSGRPA